MSVLDTLNLAAIEAERASVRQAIRDHRAVLRVMDARPGVIEHIERVPIEGKLERLQEEARALTLLAKAAEIIAGELTGDGSN